MHLQCILLLCGHIVLNESENFLRKMLSVFCQSKKWLTKCFDWSCKYFDFNAFYSSFASLRSHPYCPVTKWCSFRSDQFQCSWKTGGSGWKFVLLCLALQQHDGDLERLLEELDSRGQPGAASEAEGVASSEMARSAGDGGPLYAVDNATGTEQGPWMAHWAGQLRPEHALIGPAQTL